MDQPMNAPSTNPRRGIRARPAALLVLLLVVPCHAGSIEARVQCPSTILKAVAIQRQHTAVGVYGKEYPGISEGEVYRFNDLPPGRYDLIFQTDKGVIAGWDASVPHSDYDPEQPLAGESVAALLRKSAGRSITGFSDQAQVLDIQGNIQNATVLITELRTQPFVESAGENRDTVIWRVTRWQWENAEEQTWTPVQTAPYYAIFRERLKPAEYAAKRVLLARHLGGLEVAEDQSKVDLGIIRLPDPDSGVSAINPDGSKIPPVGLKPFISGVASPEPPATQPRPLESKEQKP